MVITIKKNAPAKVINDALKTIAKQPKKPLKGFEPKKFEGKLKRGFDGLEYQNKVRNEWN